jgi:structural maintenance of chromosome 1
MQQHEHDLQKFKQDEQKLLNEINSIEIEITELKNQVDRYKTISTKIEEEINEIRKRMSSHNKEINEFRKKVSSAETKNLDKKSERHQILKQCKLDLIELPMLVGSMDDISDEDQVIIQSQQTNTESLVSISTQDANVLYEKEARLKVNYKKLNRELTNLTNEDEIEQNEARLLSELNQLKDTLKNYQMPNFRVDERMDNVREMWENTTSEYEKAQQAAKKARTEFNRVKQERLTRFTKSFEHISGKIDEIYKSLCMNRGAQASLVLENAEEPYLEGIIYNCVAPGKRFRQMDNLSGGEKTVAALALLFAIRSYNPSPFFVLDEVDAALDNTNISKVANFIIEQSSRGLQCIVISLKEEFFHHADALIGVYPEANDCIASKILSLDLTRFNEVE